MVFVVAGLDPCEISAAGGVNGRFSIVAGDWTDASIYSGFMILSRLLDVTFGETHIGGTGVSVAGTVSDGSLTVARESVVCYVSVSGPVNRSISSSVSAPATAGRALSRGAGSSGGPVPITVSELTAMYMDPFGLVLTQLCRIL